MVWRRARAGAVAAGLLFVALAAAHAQTAPVKVTIEGIDGPVKQNVRDILALARADDEGNPLQVARIRQLYDRSAQQIREALQPFGFYDPSIHSTLTANDGTWLAHYLIHPGPPTIVQSVDVSVTGAGANAPVVQQAADQFRRERGDTLQHLVYENAKLALLGAATDSGYLKARFDSAAILVDSTADTARIVVRFDTGPLMHFGQVTFHESVINHGLLARQVPFQPGDVFRHKKLRELQNNLTSQPYWAAVEVIPHPDSAVGDRVPIDVTLTPLHPEAYEVGAGYGTDNGPRGRLTARFRRINRAGNHAQLDLSASSNEQSISAQYTIPGVLNPTGALSLLAGYALTNPTVSTSHTFIVGPRLTRKRFGWDETLSLTYQHESFTVGPDTGAVTMLVGGIGYDRSEKNNQVFPTRGYRVHGELKTSKSGVLSDVSFLRLEVGAKAVHSLLPRTRLLARADVGEVFTSAFRSLPPSIRFFTGGDETVRGYRFETLGPRTASGAPIGGKIVVAASVETDYRFLDRWAVAGFIDGGNALDSWTPLKLRYAVGPGIRWISPVGLIRLDLAYTVNRPAAISGGPWLLHLRMGPDL